MKINRIGCVLVFALSFMALSAGAAEYPTWGYSGDKGPENWGSLSPEFAACSEGKNQSPVNLTDMIESELPPLKINYQPGGYEIVNSGYTIQVNYAPGSTISIDGQEYELKQIHFHSPSENLINGDSYPLEAHLVHADKAGHLAVIALMIEAGDTNKELGKIGAQMPRTAGETKALSQSVNAAALLPQDYDYFYFNGSLTTPPCAEGVRWLVMKRHVTASKAQIEKYSQTLPHPTNRPVQPLNARKVLK